MSDQGSAVLVGDSHDLTGYTLPPGHYLVIRDGKFQWVDDPNTMDLILYKRYKNYIIKEFKMSFATGKSDAADFKQYSGILKSDWGADPFVGLPINNTGGVITPATCQDEIVHGIVVGFNEYTEEVEGVTTAFYSVTALIANGDIQVSNGAATVDYGSALFLQDYTFGSTTTFSDVWSKDEPTSGFSHPSLIINDNQSVHYNNMIRPVAI
jgi:hypothetical protein